MDIAVSRESVSMGDDVYDHTLMYTVDSDTRFSDLFQDLRKRKYFPHVSGNDVVWTLLYAGNDLMSWKTKEDSLYSHFAAGEPTVFDWTDGTLDRVYFKYYSPPMKRAQQIFKMADGSKSQMQYKGFLSEYESYSVPRAIEERWRKASSS